MAAAGPVLGVKKVLSVRWDSGTALLNSLAPLISDMYPAAAPAGCAASVAAGGAGWWSSSSSSSTASTAAWSLIRCGVSSTAAERRQGSSGSRESRM